MQTVTGIFKNRLEDVIKIFNRMLDTVTAIYAMCQNIQTVKDKQKNK